MARIDEIVGAIHRISTTIDADGLAFQFNQFLIDDERPALIHPDGTRIAFTSDRDNRRLSKERLGRGFELYTMALDGSGVVRVTATAGPTCSRTGSRSPEGWRDRRRWRSKSHGRAGADVLIRPEETPARLRAEHGGQPDRARDHDDEEEGYEVHALD
jgi:hypothetical protein